MISRSLGPEFGAAIGMIFSVANAVAVAMYVIGFCESLNDLLKSFDVRIVDNGLNDVRIIGTITVIVLTAIVIIGMEWEAKVTDCVDRHLDNYLVDLVDLTTFLIGPNLPAHHFVRRSSRLPHRSLHRTDERPVQGQGLHRLRQCVSLLSVCFSFLCLFFFTNRLACAEDIMMANMVSDYQPEKGVMHNFFTVFAVFFPAATGILAGANISGDLKVPDRFHIFDFFFV